MNHPARTVSNNAPKILALAIVALALALALALPLAPAGASARTAPLIGAGQQGAISDQYIVVMKRAATDAAKERTKTKARGKGAKIDRDYSRALNGYAARLPAAALAEVRADPDVAYVEADGVVSATATQIIPPWGLDRIDQSSLPLSKSYSYTSTGSGVKVYIIDTGIRFSHSDFAGRAVSGYDAIDGGSADDCHGHGTHVAGTAGGSTYGVAKQVSLVGVRVLDCAGSGTTASVIAGIDWVTADHGAGQPAVANMSLGGGASSALDTAVQNSINDGVSYAVAAGNEKTDACNSSPARAANALTVASTTSADARSSFSNFGTCVDLFAPGSDIMSSWHESDIATKAISGTSMAAPHVAGAAALYLQGDPTATPATVAAAVNDSATTGKVTSPGLGSPNRLLLTAFVDTTAPETVLDAAPSGATGSPSASFAFSSSEAASTFECRLDGPGGAAGSYAPCSSPTSYSGLADGSYSFFVRATDAAGNTDPTAATSSFTVDTTAPETAFDSSAPELATSSSTTFSFSSSEPASTFECRLDGPAGAAGSYAPCSSPTSYSGLADGSYSFFVRATDAAGNTDPTAATSSFTVDTTAPETVLDAAPPGATASPSASFAFSSSEPASTFECRLDGPGGAAGSYAPCSSPTSYRGLADGSYSFFVRATDAAGNTDPTAATSSFTLRTSQPAPSPAPAPPPAPAAAPAPPPEPLPPVDSLAPLVALTGSKLQALGKDVRLTVSCRTEPCIATISGVINVPKKRAARGRLFKLKTVTTTIAKGATVTLSAKLPFSAQGAIRRALAQGRQVTVKLTVTAADAANNSRTLTRHIKLRPAPRRGR